MNWLLNKENLAFVTVAGSQAYGMATENSDVDVKGFVLPPQSVREDMFHKFEQAENSTQIEEHFSYLKNPSNPKMESTIYSLEKFLKLAGAVNPNIIELLWVDDKSIAHISEIGEKVLENRNLFLSSKVKQSFSGYAYSQFYKIERHRKWILKGIMEKPTREEYGLPEFKHAGMGELFRLLGKDIENWNMSKYPLDDLQRSEIKEYFWELINGVTGKNINWDNWPGEYERAAFEKMVSTLSIPKEITTLMVREIQYKNDLKEYNSWEHWAKERNADRKALEIAFSYDTKHAAHLIRLMRMGCEILESGVVKTLRPDAEELLAIRNGKISYEELMAEFKKLEERLELAYKNTQLPRVVNYEKIQELYFSFL